MDIFASYQGKRVIVTGCHSGIGQATARLLIDSSAQVHGLDIGPGDRELASFTPLDLRDPGAIAAAARSIGGPVDAVFNCAGVAPGPSPIDVMKVNFIGTRHLTSSLLPFMAEGSAIVSVASNGGAGWTHHLGRLLEFTGTASFEAAVEWYEDNAAALPAAYSFSKEAIIVWTLQASAQLIKRGIRINCTNPGAVQTPMLEEIEKTTPTAAIDTVAQPIGRRSSASEQAWPLLFLNSAQASYINGAVLPVDGGFLGARAIEPGRSLAGLGRK